MTLMLYTGSQAGPARLVGPHVIRMAQFALANPGLHSFNRHDRATCRALATLERMKLIDVENDTDQFQWCDRRTAK